MIPIIKPPHKYRLFSLEVTNFRNAVREDVLCAGFFESFRLLLLPGFSLVCFGFILSMANIPKLFLHEAPIV
jgi:hypothetical protein